MDKPITEWPSDLEAMAAEALVIPSRRLLPPDGEWRPEPAALAHRAAGGSSAALADFNREEGNVEIEIRRYERRHRETREPIAHEKALGLAKRIEELRLRHLFEAREDYIAFLAGQCLTLRVREGEAAGDAFAACASLEAKWPPKWAGLRWPVTLAVPAELHPVVAAPFGGQSFAWLCRRCERVARTLARRGLPPDSPACRMFDGGDFALVIDSIRPGEVAAPVVLASDKDAVAKHIERAKSCPDHWEALKLTEKLTEKMLWTSRGRLGEALSAWGNPPRPDGRKAAKHPRQALRNLAIIEAVRALERCGIPPTRNRDRRWLAKAHGWEGAVDPDYDPPSGCGIVAKAFEMKATAVEKVLS